MARSDVSRADNRSQDILPAPRFATAWASVTYTVSCMLLAYPALTGLFLLNTRSDQYKAGYTIREFAAQSLRTGHGFPLWNPFMEGGLPYVAAMHGDIFYPTFLLRIVLPTDVAMTWEFPLHLFLCGLFTYFFLRAWGVGFYGALVGGLAYMLGGSIAGYAGPGHDGKLFVSTMLPASLLILTRGIRDGRAWAWGALAFVIGLAVLSPHPQLLQYMLLVDGAFSLYLAFATLPGAGRLDRNLALKRLGLATIAVVIGGLIGAVQFGPALFEYKPWSPRAGGHDWDTATSYSFPIEETINAYLPQFSGILDNYWGRNIIHFHSDYFGVIVLLLLGAAFGRAGSKSFRNFWLATGLVGLFWAFGRYTPFFQLVYAIVPGTKYFRAPSTIIYVPAFAVAVLAALGMERVLSGRIGARYALGWIIASLVIAILISVGGYTTLSTALLSTMRESTPPGYLEGLLEPNAARNTSAAIMGAWRSFAFVLLGAGVIWAFVNGKLGAKVVVIALPALLIVDLWSIERLYWTFSAPASKLFASDPAVDAINADIAKSHEPGRVWTTRLGEGVAQGDAAFSGDALMGHGIRLVGNYHGNELGIYQQLVAAGDLTPNRPITVYSPPFWRHENVRYLYTDGDPALVSQLADSLKAGPFTQIAGPVRNAAGSMVYAYRLPGNNPAARVATAMVKAPESQALGTVLDPRFDPSTVAIVDTSASSIQGVQLQSIPAPSANAATVTTYGVGAIDVSLAAPSAQGAALVVSENYFPGWQATADGKAAPVGRMNYNLIGVALPPGSRMVQLRFDDAAYEKGKVITLMALAIAILGWGAGALIDRRGARAAAA